MDSQTVQAPPRYVTLRLRFSEDDLAWLTSQDYGISTVLYSRRGKFSVEDWEAWGGVLPGITHHKRTLERVTTLVGETIASVLSEGLEIDLGLRRDRGGFVSLHVTDQVVKTLQERKRNGSQVSILLREAMVDNYVRSSISFIVKRVLYLGWESIGESIGDDIPNIKGQPPYNVRGYDPFDR